MRRSEILEAARAVFLRSGFAGARIREISELAGINESLLYRHFRSKDALFEAAITEPLDELLDELLRYKLKLRASMNSAELHALVIDLLDALLDNARKIAPLFMVLVFSDGNRGHEFYLTRIRPAIEALSDALESSGEFWDRRAFDPQLVVMSALATAIALALDDSVEGGVHCHRRDIARELADNILYGLLEHPGSA